MSQKGSGESATINLESSKKIIHKFLHHVIYNILYSRGVYDSTMMEQTVNDYGVYLHRVKDRGVQKYIKEAMSFVQQAVQNNELQKLVIVITPADDRSDVLERWVFAVGKRENNDGAENFSPNPESKEDIGRTISQIMKEVVILGAVIPAPRETRTFEILVYTNKDTVAPTAWQESDPQYVVDAEDVGLRQLKTPHQTVTAGVSYKLN